MWCRSDLTLFSPNLSLGRSMKSWALLVVSLPYLQHSSLSLETIALAQRAKVLQSQVCPNHYQIYFVAVHSIRIGRCHHTIEGTITFSEKPGLDSMSSRALVSYDRAINVQTEINFVSTPTGSNSTRSTMSYVSQTWGILLLDGPDSKLLVESDRASARSILDKLFILMSCQRWLDVCFKCHVFIALKFQSFRDWLTWMVFQSYSVYNWSSNIFRVAKCDESSDLFVIDLRSHCSWWQASTQNGMCLWQKPTTIHWQQ